MHAGLQALLLHGSDGGAKLAEHFDKQRGPIDASMRWVLPELCLAAMACLILLVDLKAPRAKSRAICGGLAAAACVVTGILILVAPHASTLAGDGLGNGLFHGMLTVDAFAKFLKLLFLGGTLVTVAFTAFHKDFDGWRMGEYWTLILTSVLGMFFMVSGTDFLMIYLAIEMVSLTSFVLVAYTRSDPRATEAALKYVIYGAAASGMMLFGLSYLYGVTGSTRIADLPLMMERLGTSGAGTIAAFLALAGVGYKIAAVPMHFWAPDVYEGAPTPITAWLSVTSKAAGIGLLVRLVAAAEVGTQSPVSWAWLTAILSAATMTLGNFAALRQTNIKRLLAYSSIAHAGYLMMGATVLGSGTSTLVGGTTLLSPEATLGFQAIAFYLAVYALMNLGGFGVVLFVRNATGSESIEAYRGLGWRHPWIGVAFAILLFSFIGVPPTAGFFAKWWLFQAVLSAGGLTWLAVVAALNTAVSAYFYMSLVKAMYLEEAPADAPEIRFPNHAVATILGLAAPVLLLGLWSTPLAKIVQGLSLRATVVGAATPGAPK